jgi:hypothetical protein
MGTMTDAVDPANIPASLDGTPALRISVLASRQGQAFDGEKGNAGPSAVADTIAVKMQDREWSVLYVNQDTEGAYVGALAAKGIRPVDFLAWPEPGVYLWCADPSGNIAAGKWKPAAAPIAVQDRYPGPIDQSTTFGTFPAQAAGYIDGPISVWPEAAWERFALITGPISEPSPSPAPSPAPPTGSESETVTPEQMTQLVGQMQMMLREEFAGPSNELFGRIVQAVLEALGQYPAAKA